MDTSTKQSLALALEKPDVNTRAMGMIAGVSIVTLPISALVMQLVGGGALSLQALLLYACAVCFIVFIFMLPKKPRYFACIPVAAWAILYSLGVIFNPHCAVWFKAFTVFLSLLTLIVFALKLFGVMKWVFPAIAVPAATALGCVAYCIYDTVVRFIDAFKSWSDTVSTPSGSFLGGLVANEEAFELLNLGDFAFPFILPAGLLFFVASLCALLLAEPHTEEADDD